MNKNPRRLGRGLSSILSVPDDFPDEVTQGSVPPPEAPRASPASVKVERIQPNAFQPRKDMDPAELKSLADSIRQAGIIQPIIVRPRGQDRYELIAGERRWRAAQMAGLAEVPVVVREATDEEMLEVALVENIFRTDLNAIDRAQAYRRYCDQFNLSAEDVAQRLGEDRTTVTNYLRLLDLPSEVKEWVASGKLSMGHARCLLAIKSPSDLVQTARQAIDQDLSVRALEKLVRDRVAARAAASRPPAEAREAKRPQIRKLEQAFVHGLGTKVEINESRRRGAGRIVIHYFNLDDFDRIAQRLGVELDG